MAKQTPEQTIEMLLSIEPDTAFISITGKYEEKRRGQRATVLGVVLLTNPYFKRRPCFHVRWQDGDEDYVPIQNANRFMQVYTD